MGIDDKARRFFHTDVKMQLPHAGERFACVHYRGMYFIAAGPIVMLTEGEAVSIDAETRKKIDPGIISRIYGGEAA